MIWGRRCGFDVVDGKEETKGEEEVVPVRSTYGGGGFLVVRTSAEADDSSERVHTGGCFFSVATGISSSHGALPPFGALDLFGGPEISFSRVAHAVVSLESAASNINVVVVFVRSSPLS